MSASTRTKYIGLRREAKQQMDNEYLWKALKQILAADIFGDFCLANTDVTQEQYLMNVESKFFSKACNYGVSVAKIKHSKAFGMLCCITRKYELDPSALKLSITQVRTCADRQTRHAVFT
tara:strand:- start:6 stop:365 length:360 start_codon:yes stop_codon:yes gene_type:complete